MKKLWVFFLVGVMLFLNGCTKDVQSSAAIHKITGSELYQEKRLNENLAIIDVRLKEEYDQGHIENAINILVDKISEDTMKDYDVNRKIIVYCRSGKRSEQAAQKLKELGFKNIYNLGGLDDNWEYSLVKEVNDSKK